MNRAYFQTRFRTGGPVPQWPSQFVIVSAFATTGEVWSAEQNRSADAELEAVLRSRGGWLVRVVGYSPATGHAEPSWAFEAPFEDACELGRRFLQDAIFCVAAGRLFVTHCDDRRGLVEIGQFSDFLDAPHECGG